MANRLAQQSSPYLLQHKDNPVDWYPWGDEAFAAAKSRGVPLLVSIGYSTCHWCHVMAHESFEDDDIAALMNANFVNVKVDREERPDVDALYMQSVQAMGYGGGWPLNVFLTPDGLPFFGGTYWPPVAREGIPSFTQVLVNIHDLWLRDRARVVHGGQDVAKHIIGTSGITGTPGEVTGELLRATMRALYDKFDSRRGGFGSAPKFPQAMTLDFLLRHYLRTGDIAALSMVEITLGAMSEGGIHDQLGGGFARYSVDANWHIPHFEKMLYDNALLLPLYVDTYRMTDEPVFLHSAEGIVGWLLRDMLLAEGGLAAALDADSEGREGTYYVWTADEIDSLFEPDDADLIKLHFGIADFGSFDGANVLRIAKSNEDLADNLGISLSEVNHRLAAMKATLLHVREQRAHPHRDDKVIASWNGMIIHALAYSGLVLQRPDWIALARRAASFATRNMISDDGSLARIWANGKSSASGVLDDYAHMARGLLTLYGATDEVRWADTAWQLITYTQSHFQHESGIGYYDTPAFTSDLFTRPRDLTDSATPSGNAVMAEVLQILAIMRRDDALADQARRIITSLTSMFTRYPMHTGAMAAAAERMMTAPRELILTGKDTSNLVAAGVKKIDPLVIRGYVHTNDSDWAFLEDKPASAEPMAYWCHDFMCLAPVSTTEELIAAMK